MGFEKSSPPRERSRAFKKRKQAFSSLKRALACGAALMLVAGLGGGMSTARAETISFATQETGTYAGLPLFDGVPAHLENYLDALMDYAGLDAAVNWANGRRRAGSAWAMRRWPGAAMSPTIATPGRWCAGRITRTSA